jgi:hypothetical protein
VVAGLLGLEMLASLDGDRQAALALFDRARTLAETLDRLRPLASLLAALPRFRPGSPGSRKDPGNHEETPDAD